MGLNRQLEDCLQSFTLPEQELNHLSEAFSQVIKQRIDELSSLVDTAQRHVEAYETKYKTDFKAFKTIYVKDLKSFQEDFVHWGFWTKLRDNRLTLLSRYQELITSQNEC